MESKNRISNKFLGLVLILCITKVCHGQLMCYVCDDCEKVSAQTPQFECSDDFFNNGGATSSSVQTTTEHSTTTGGSSTESGTTSMDDTTLTSSTINTEEATTTTSTTTKLTTITTTESKSPETTTKSTTENVTETTTLKEMETTQETTSTTEEQPPSPPTQGPPKSTTALPTPPTPDSLIPLDDVEHLNNRTAAPHDQHVNKDEVESVDVEQGTAKPYKPSAEIRVRQLRSVSDVSFHCFKVKATLENGTMVVNRGCARVATNESVCGQWETQHPMDKMNKCYPCSRTKCNGSSALTVSITALFVAVVAFLIHRE